MSLIVPNKPRDIARLIVHSISKIKIYEVPYSLGHSVASKEGWDMWQGENQ